MKTKKLKQLKFEAECYELTRTLNEYDRISNKGKNQIKMNQLNNKKTKHTSVIASQNEKSAYNIKRYHKSKGFPKGVVLPTKAYLLNYSLHAKREAIADGYSPENCQLPLWLNFSEVEIFEIEVENLKITKVGCRISYNDKLDLTLIICITDYSVKTVWFNLKSDRHKTIDLSKYNNPNK